MKKWLDQYKSGGSANSLNRTVTCSNCGWSWKLSDGGKDPMICHKCGGDIKMQNGGELDEYQDRGQVDFRNQLLQQQRPIVDAIRTQQFVPISEQEMFQNRLRFMPQPVQLQIRQGQKETPYSKQYSKERKAEELKRQVQRNSDLAKTFASFTPGNNIEAGVMGAETFANLNPVMSGPILAASRLAPAIMHPTNNVYWGSDRSIGENALGVLGAAGDVAMISPYFKGMSKPKVFSEGQPYEGAPHIYQDMYPINGRYQPRTVITDAGVKNEILGLEPTPVVPTNAIEYPVTPNKFLYGPHDDFGRMEEGLVRNTTPSTQESIWNNILKNSSENKKLPPPQQLGMFNFKGAFQKYPKGPLTQEEINAFKNSDYYKFVTKNHLEDVKKYGDSWKLPNYAEETLQRAIETGNRDVINDILYGGYNWGANNYIIAGLAGTAYPGVTGLYGLAFSPPAVKNKVLNSAGITSKPGVLSSKDTTINITNKPMDFVKVNETADGQIIIGGEFIEDANNTVRKAKDWLTATDTYSDKEYSSKDIQSFYGIENGKFKVGKASDFKPNTEIVPRRFGATNISQAILNEGAMRLLDNEGNPIYQNTPNTGKFILYSPSTKEAEFNYINTGKSGVDKVNKFLKKNKDAQYIHLDNGRYEFYGLNPNGLSEQDFEDYYQQDLEREGNPGYNMIIKQQGGPIITNRGQWDYPGQTTIIPSNEITMQGVPYPVMGVSNTGDVQYMQPGEDYTYDGDYVTEYPMMQQGGMSISDLKKAYVDAYNNYNQRNFPKETLETRQKAYNTIEPSSYLDIENYRRWNVNEKRKTYYDPRSEEAWKFYLGLTTPEEMKYIKKSKYRPTINPTEKYYYSVDPQLEQDIFNYYKDKVKLNKTLQTDESEIETPLSGEDGAGMLGRFGVSRGHDEQGDYLSYYDRYDLKKFAEKRSKGVPYSIYGRIYYPKKEQGQEIADEYKSGGQHGGLDRWFAEKWVDIKTGKPCGRQEGESRKGYPACRPSKRISSDTPKTSSELSSSERERFKREKTSSQRISYQHQRREDGGEILNLEQMKSGGNVPTNPSLWSRAKSLARQKYDVYPSAYANGWAAKWYKSHGGGWRKAEYGMEVMGDGGVPNNPGFNALPEYVQQNIINNMAAGGQKMPPQLAYARFAAAGNLNQLGKYGYQDGGERLPNDFNKFQEFNKTLPDNLRNDNFKYGDYSHYDLYGMWDASGKPKSFDDVKDTEQFGLQEDGTYHGFSVGNDGIWLKPKSHPSAFMEYMQSQLSTDPYFKDNHVIQREDGRLQYVPNNYITKKSLKQKNETDIPQNINSRFMYSAPPSVFSKGGESVTLNTGGENHRIYVKTTNRGEGAKGHIMVNHPTMDKGIWDTIDLTEKAGATTIAQGVAATKKWHRENPYMKQKGGEKEEYWRTGKPMVNDPSMDAISKVLLQRNLDKNFMQRAAGFGYQGGIPTRYIPGQDPDSNDISTLLISSSDNIVFPTIIQTGPEQLSYQPKQTQEYLEAPSWDVADYFAAKGYKRAANDMYGMEYQGGGQIPTVQGNFKKQNKYGYWVTDEAALAKEAQRLNSKKVLTEGGSLIIFDDNWNIVGVDDNPGEPYSNSPSDQDVFYKPMPQQYISEYDVNQYAEGGITYKVKKGDNLTEIANSVNVPIENIIRINKIKNPDLIYPGQELIISEKLLKSKNQNTLNKNKFLDFTNKPIVSSTAAPIFKPISREEMMYNHFNTPKQQHTLSKSKPQSKLSKTKEVILNPATAAQYLINKQRIPDNLSAGKRNILDYAADIVNPAFYINAAGEAITNTGEGVYNIARGNYGEGFGNLGIAGMNALVVAPFVPKIGKILRNTPNDLNFPKNEIIKNGQTVKNSKEFFKLHDNKPLKKNEIKFLNKELEDRGILEIQRAHPLDPRPRIFKRGIVPEDYNIKSTIKNFIPNILKGQKYVNSKITMGNVRINAFNQYLGLPTENTAYRIHSNSFKNGKGLVYTIPQKNINYTSSEFLSKLNRGEIDMMNNIENYYRNPTLKNKKILHSEFNKRYGQNIKFKDFDPDMHFDLSSEISDYGKPIILDDRTVIPSWDYITGTGGNAPFIKEGNKITLKDVWDINPLSRIKKLPKFIRNIDAKHIMGGKEFELNNTYRIYPKEIRQTYLDGGELNEYAEGGGIPERYRNMGFTKVGAKRQSTRPGKKWMVLAKKGDQYKVVHGGWKGMQDFKQHHSEQRRENFWSRMGGKNSSKATNPFSPLYWHKRFGTWQQGGQIMKIGGQSTLNPIVKKDNRNWLEYLKD